MKHIILSIICFLFMCGSIYGQVYTYNGTTATLWTVGWDQVEVDDVMPTWIIEIGAILSETADTYYIGQVNVMENQYKFKSTIVGTNVLRARMCDPGENECSDWAISTDPEQATVDGVPMGWNLSIEKAPPTDIIIDDLLDMGDFYKYGFNKEKDYQLDSTRRFDYGRLQDLLCTREWFLELPVTIC